MNQLDPILIANRGEIVARVARTARALGYRTVGVYSAADASAPYLDAVGEAVAIGPAAASLSYLSIERLLDAARLTGARAVHPGYGFLSENAAFADACAAAGLTWIGPPPAVLRLMGEKAAAKAAMTAAGIPCVPGVDGRGLSDGDLARAATALGVPLLIKAAAGGGGRGMRRVDRLDHLAASLADSRREAEAAFGSGDLLVERAVDGARHVEVQVLFDTHGHGVHLGERDCSAQRRHQKIVEESPCAALDAKARGALCGSALAAAKAAGYVGAGTLEFLVAPSGEHWFLEMNARLQVEHPVTEMVTGVDLVEWQLRIAAGERLALSQEGICTTGHAIEARLYAEDADRGFLPQSGTLVAWKEAALPGVRTDHALRAGMTVQPHYDPMLAKIVARGADREQARRLLLRAIERTRALGLMTNKAFLLRLLGSDAFAAGAVTTDFVEPWVRGEGATPAAPIALPALAALILSGIAERRAGHDSAQRSTLPWALALDDGADAIEVRSAPRGGTGSHHLLVGGTPVEIALASMDHDTVVYVEGGVRRSASYVRDGEGIWLETQGAIASYRQRAGRARSDGTAADDGELRAPMAAQVVAVAVTAGDRVEKGARLVTLRAMKLEHRVVAPAGGLVREVLVREGEQVAFRQVLVRLEAAKQPAAMGEAGRR